MTTNAVQCSCGLNCRGHVFARLATSPPIFTCASISRSRAYKLDIEFRMSGLQLPLQLFDLGFQFFVAHAAKDTLPPFFHGLDKAQIMLWLGLITPKLQMFPEQF